MNRFVMKKTHSPPPPSPRTAALAKPARTNDAARVALPALESTKKQTQPCSLRATGHAPGATARETSRSWASVATTSIWSRHPTYKMVNLPSVDLPRTQMRLPCRTLTLEMPRTILSYPDSTRPATTAATRALADKVGPSLRLDPHTGAPERQPPSIATLGIAPDSSPQSAVASFTVAQAALQQGALLSSSNLPPHVIIPGVGCWTNMYIPSAALANLTAILSHVRTTYEDLQIQITSLPYDSHDLDPSAAVRVARRINREAASLRRRIPTTTVPIPLRTALSEALSAHATAVKTSLPCSAHCGCALSMVALLYPPFPSHRTPIPYPPASPHAPIPTLTSVLNRQLREAPQFPGLIISIQPTAGLHDAD